MPSVRPSGSAVPMPASAAIPTPESNAAPELIGYRWSGRVVGDVMRKLGVESPVALLREATKVDDGNKYLNRSELTAAAQTLLNKAMLGYRWSPSVLDAVLLGAGITDAQAVLQESKNHDDGNKYLTRGELTSAASALANRGDDKYRFSRRVLTSVMNANGLTNEKRLLDKAKTLDNGNKYLNRAELSAAAAQLGEAAPAVGYISDLDKTIIPAHSGALPAKPYPGVRALLAEIEGVGDGQAGDAYYVTARTPDHMDGVHDWLAEHELPAGPVDTGVSVIGWKAENEKVKDISAIMDAHPDQNFVLFGDSSHRDPEVFKRLIAKYPGRITAAIMHKVNNVNPNRVTGLTLIENYADATADLLSKGVIDVPAARRVLIAAKSEGLAITNAQIDALIEANTP